MENAKRKMEECDRPRDIPTRAFLFGVRILQICQRLQRKTDVPYRLTNPLFGAGTAIGANVEEGQAAQSKADFIAKCSISLKEARECGYWLK